MATLDNLPHRQPALIVKVGGLRAFRRRLLEMGLVPGTEVQVTKVAPLGDPIEIDVRGSRLSIRKYEARLIEVSA